MSPWCVCVRCAGSSHRVAGSRSSQVGSQRKCYGLDFVCASFLSLLLVDLGASEAERTSGWVRWWRRVAAATGAGCVSSSSHSDFMRNLVGLSYVGGKAEKETRADATLSRGRGCRAVCGPLRRLGKTMSICSASVCYLGVLLVTRVL